MRGLPIRVARLLNQSMPAGDLVLVADLRRLVEVVLELEDLLRQRVALLLKLSLGDKVLVGPTKTLLHPILRVER